MRSMATSDGVYNSHLTFAFSKTERQRSKKNASTDVMYECAFCVCTKKNIKILKNILQSNRWRDCVPSDTEFPAYLELQRNWPTHVNWVQVELRDKLLRIFVWDAKLIWGRRWNELSDVDLDELYCIWLFSSFLLARRIRTLRVTTQSGCWNSYTFLTSWSTTCQTNR